MPIPTWVALVLSAVANVGVVGDVMSDHKAIIMLSLAVIGLAADGLQLDHRR